MSCTLNYNRPVAALVAVTPIDTSLLVGELPDAPTAIGGTGTTCVTDLRIQGDADPTGGAQVQDLFKVVVTPTISSDGKMAATVVVTPVAGAGGDLPAQTLVAEHPETTDAWQAAAGFPRV